MRPRIALVTGGSGYAGTSLIETLQRRAVRVVAPRSSELDVTDAGAVRRALGAIRPDRVFHLAAAQPGEPDERLVALNVAGAEAMARAAAEIGARLVHVSTDVVLDGRGAPFGDAAAPRPVTPYGLSKARGEAAVADVHPHALIVRTSLLWDPDAPDRSTAGFAARLAAGEPCALFTDEIRCPLARTDLAAALADLAETQESGTLNVAGRQALSRYAFGTRLLRHFRVPGLEQIAAVRAADQEAAGGPPRPRDLTLDVARAEALLGRALRGVDEVLSGRRA